jgi:hypothetical protein
VLALALLVSSPRGASAARDLKEQKTSAPTTATATTTTVCVPTTLEFVAAAGGASSDAALLAAKTNPTPLLAGPLCPPGSEGDHLSSVPLPQLKAFDNCGYELPVTVMTTAAEAPASGDGGDGPGIARLDLALVPCGAFEVLYSAELADGELLAEKTFTFERLCADQEQDRSCL